MKGLEGLKVVELTSYVAGPACPRILAEMGATVYKTSLSRATITAITQAGSACPRPK